MFLAVKWLKLFLYVAIHLIDIVIGCTTFTIWLINYYFIWNRMISLERNRVKANQCFICFVKSFFGGKDCLKNWIHDHPFFYYIFCQHKIMEYSGWRVRHESLYEVYAGPRMLLHQCTSNVFLTLRSLYNAFCCYCFLCVQNTALQQPSLKCACALYPLTLTSYSRPH